MISIEFFITSLVVVLIPGTGAIYTVATSLLIGRRAGVVAAIGCTLSIVPALLGSAFGLSALLYTSALAFQIVKYLGTAYLLYLAWQMWHSASPLMVSYQQQRSSWGGIAIKGFLINFLNPKLSMFFLAFLPQFIPVTTDSTFISMLILGGVFMIMTFVVFLVYAILCGSFKPLTVNSEKTSSGIQRFFATCLAAMGLKLAMS